MAAAGVCDITPVEGVTVSVRGGAHNSFEVEWRDMRCLPTSSDADVSRNATPRAFLDSTRTVHGLVAILHKIVFGEGQDDTGKATESGGAAADPAASAGGALTIYLQRRRSRAVMRRVAVTPDGSGQAMTVTVYNGANATVLRQVAPWGFLAQLSEMCSGDDGFVLVRETCWYVRDRTALCCAAWAVPQTGLRRLTASRQSDLESVLLACRTWRACVHGFADATVLRSGSVQVGAAVRVVVARAQVPDAQGGQGGLLHV